MTEQLNGRLKTVGIAGGVLLAIASLLWLTAPYWQDRVGIESRISGIEKEMDIRVEEAQRLHATFATRSELAAALEESRRFQVDIVKRLERIEDKLDKRK